MSDTGTLNESRSVLDPMMLEERLFRIEALSRGDFPNHQEYVEAIKEAIFRLRLDVARASSNG